MPPSPAGRERLDAAYRATSYRVGQKLLLRVGEGNAVLDLLLANRELDEWAYLTAYNPRSVQLSPEENSARQKTLLARLAGYPLMLGEAVADSGEWAPEASVLVLGIRRAHAISLAREMEQNAILCGRRGGPAELAWTDDGDAAPA